MYMDMINRENCKEQGQRTNDIHLSFNLSSYTHSIQDSDLMTNEKYREVLKSVVRERYYSECTGTLHTTVNLLANIQPKTHKKIAILITIIQD